MNDLVVRGASSAGDHLPPAERPGVHSALRKDEGSPPLTEGDTTGTASGHVGRWDDLEWGFDLQQPPGHYNPQLCRARLRRNAGPPVDLVVDFSADPPRAALYEAGKQLLAGPLGATVRVDGTRLSPCGPWQEVLWHRERSCDYLEIAQPLDGGWRLARQMLLARQDAILLLADSVLAPAGVRGTITYELAWPLAEGVRLVCAAQTREGWLVQGRRRMALLLPLALPEWRADFEEGVLMASEGSLRLCQVGRGAALYAPLWIDLAPSRVAQARTWRRLTVGENLAVVPRDEAVGYRVQVGRRQWLLYHSLAPVGNRSVLGLNTCAAFVCGRFLSSGKVRPIVVIE